MSLPTPIARRALVIALLLAGAFLPAWAQNSPVEMHCSVHGAGGTITAQLNEDMRHEVNEKMRETLELYNLECLQGMVRFGGLGQLGISWPNLYEMACKAILEEISAAGPPPSGGVVFTRDRLMAALDDMRTSSSAAP